MPGLDFSNIPTWLWFIIIAVIVYLVVFRKKKS